MQQIHYTVEEIRKKREAVRQQFISRSSNISSGTITQISTTDLSLLFGLYDQLFLGGYVTHNLKGKLILSLSGRMTKVAGKTMVPQNIAHLKPEAITYEIRVGVNFFFQYYSISRDKVVCGIKTSDALEAFQIVFEHELCHLVEYHEFRSSSCKKERFKTIARNIFGHTDVYHHLPTDREIADAMYGFKVGDRVSFEFEGKQMKGIINGIHKRATVMVPDKNGMYADRKGKRYSKYYVSLNAMNNIG